MSALLKYVKHTIFLMTALAIASYIGLLSLVGIWNLEDVAPAPAKPEAAVVPVDPARGAPVDEELDYRAVQRLGSLEGWRGFLATHRNSVYAQSARAEVEQLLLAEKVPPPAAAAVSNGASTDASAASEAMDPTPVLSGTEVPSGHAIPAPVAAEVSNDASPDAKAVNEAPPAPPSPGTEVAALSADEVCKRDADRLAELRSRPLGDEAYRFANELEAARFANELDCGKLRPQVLGLVESLAHAVPVPAAAEVSTDASPHTEAVSEAAPPAPPSSGTEVAALSPDEVCKRDGDRLAELRSRPSSDEAARFANELGCEKLRPQVLGLMESFAQAIPAPAAAEISNDASPDAKALSEGARPAPPLAGTEGWAGTEVAALTPVEACKRDGDRLARLGSSPASGAERFAHELGCEKLRPQVLGLTETLANSVPAPAAAAEVSNGASSDAKAVDEAAPAAPRTGTEVVALTPDETCKRDGDRLARLRGSPSDEEAQRLAREFGCQKLRPQLQRLMESLGFAPPPAPANSSPADSLLTEVCASQRAALDRLRKEPSAEAVRLFWRDLQCEPLRPQVRLLMESLNLTPESLGSAAPPGAVDGHEGATPDAPTPNGADPTACHREAAELNRIRATPDLGDAKRFASIVTCDVLKPQAARLLESLTE
jgi:hypothetical protein